jgi:ribosomal-protein-alanine N-acetyltransferase
MRPYKSLGKNIEKIVETDADGLAKIHAECFSANWSDGIFSSMIIDRNFFGFMLFTGDVKKTACGFILYKTLFDESEIITFCVLPKYQRLGFGKALLKKMIDALRSDAKKYGTYESIKIFLEVSCDNSNAISLYRSFGFIKILERPNYYKTKTGASNADLMVLKIENVNNFDMSI